MFLLNLSSSVDGTHVKANSLPLIIQPEIQALAFKLGIDRDEILDMLPSLGETIELDNVRITRRLSTLQNGKFIEVSATHNHGEYVHGYVVFESICILNTLNS